MSSECNGVEIDDLLQSKTILILLYILMVKYILIMNIILSANACSFHAAPLHGCSRMGRPKSDATVEWSDADTAAGNDGKWAGDGGEDHDDDKDDD